MQRVTAALMLIVLTVPSVPARAHFLFIRIGEPAEAGRTVEVFFSEKADAGDPRFIAEVAGAALTLRSRDPEIKKSGPVKNGPKFEADSTALATGRGPCQKREVRSAFRFWILDWLTPAP
jgi:hypothetical protein